MIHRIPTLWWRHSRVCIYLLQVTSAQLWMITMVKHNFKAFKLTKKNKWITQFNHKQWILYCSKFLVCVYSMSICYLYWRVIAKIQSFELIFAPSFFPFVCFDEASHFRSVSVRTIIIKCFPKYFKHVLMDKMSDELMVYSKCG